MKKKMKNIISFFVLTYLAMLVLPVFTEAATASSEERKANLEVVTVQQMYLPADLEGADEVIKSYEETGWTYKDNYLTRRVHVQDPKVYIDGKEYTSKDNDNLVDVPLSEESRENVKEVSLNEDSSENTQKIALEEGKTSTLTVFVDLDKVIEGMDEHLASSNEETAMVKTESDGQVAAKGLKNGERPSNGQAIHCNRFNGYLGDGKYYNKTQHPVLAAKNFTFSDCDRSLGNYTYCLKDYGSNPYCANSPSSKNGWCSTLSKVNHARTYHKHTSFFSPSGK
ncbi:hypothetical protein [Priestia filamentosa]|uniref:hypothetical protein n=1 Tax=Priestia filamentosa TaxID=1402861 RepID=UPI0002D648BF|nr:hypothetical protein [Priestia filamentosa]